MSTPNPKMLSVIDSSSDSSRTYAFQNEDHTLGNALRHALMQQEETDFCGYTVPHPSETIMHLRLQTPKGVKADKVLEKGLHHLKQVNQHVRQTFLESLETFTAAAP